MMKGGGGLCARGVVDDRDVVERLGTVAFRKTTGVSVASTDPAPAKQSLPFQALINTLLFLALPLDPNSYQFKEHRRLKPFPCQISIYS